MAKTKKTNEQEFQGRIVVWLCDLIKIRQFQFLDIATVEKPGESTAKRNDLVVWKSRATADAFLTIELKTPQTSISDPVFFHDALAKARHWKAPMFCIWNMQRAELYTTPAIGDAPPTTPSLPVIPRNKSPPSKIG